MWWGFVGTAYVNLVKLCVGCDSVEDLAEWQARRRAEDPARPLQHVTRMWPKREADLLNGGSLFWVFKGVIGARQRIERLEERVGDDGIRRCALILAPEIIRTAPARRAPFQGWRYLSSDDAPRDLPQARDHEDALPPQLAAALDEIGLR